MLLSAPELGALGARVPELTAFLAGKHYLEPIQVKRIVDRIMRQPERIAEANRPKLFALINHLNAERRGITLH